MAAYLVNLNRAITALSTTEAAEIVRFYSSLPPNTALNARRPCQGHGELPGSLVALHLVNKWLKGEPT